MTTSQDKGRDQTPLQDTHETETKSEEPIINRFVQLIERLDPDQFDKAVGLFFYKFSMSMGISLSILIQLMDLAPEPWWDISRYLDDPISTPRKGVMFDSQRTETNRFISQFLSYPTGETAEGKAKLLLFARSLYTRILKAFLQEFSSTTDVEYKKSLRGILWSVIATDLNKTLVPRGSIPLSSHWIDKMRKMIFTPTLDVEAMKSEFMKFEQGNSEVFEVKKET